VAGLAVTLKLDDNNNNIFILNIFNLFYKIYFFPLINYFLNLFYNIHILILHFFLIILQDFSSLAYTLTQSFLTLQYLIFLLLQFQDTI